MCTHPAPTRGASRASSLMWSGWRWPQRCRTWGASRRRGKDAGIRADGPSACPGSSLHERDKRRHQRRLLGHVSKPQNPSRAERRRCPASVAGCLHRQPGRALFERTAALCLEALKGAGRHGCRPRFDSHGAAGAVKRLSVPHVPSWENGRETTEDRRALEPDKSNGAMTHVLNRSPDAAKRNPGFIYGVSPGLRHSRCEASAFLRTAA
jgi:hypothetical protein